MTKKKPSCPICGAKLTGPDFCLPEECTYSIFAFRGKEWKLITYYNSLIDAVRYAENPAGNSEWVVVYSNEQGEVVWGPEWVPGWETCDA